MAILMMAHAKINWALEVTGVRPDGYHALDMLMQRIDLADELFMEPARWISLTVDGKSIPSGGRNLVVRAANALNEYMGTRRGARIRLKKRIPVRAGLGGGSGSTVFGAFESADAAQKAHEALPGSVLARTIVQ